LRSHQDYVHQWTGTLLECADYGADAPGPADCDYLMNPS
jgi:hypothetical protein